MQIIYLKIKFNTKSYTRQEYNKNKSKSFQTILNEEINKQEINDVYYNTINLNDPNYIILNAVYQYLENN